MAVFITGTGTDIGKTTISAWLCLHTNATYWKPIQTGGDYHTDTSAISALSNCTTIKENYRLKEPLSPHAAAELENVVIDMEKFSKPSINSLIIEGAGGVIVPINQEYTMIDLIKKLETPVIVVALSGLGTINHTCLTLEALRARGITVLGVIMNGPNNPSNKKAIEFYGKTKVLAEFPNMKKISKKNLLDLPLSDALQKALQENL